MEMHRDIFAQIPKVREIEATAISKLQPFFDKKEPFIVKRFVRDWPLVAAGLSSARAARDYLAKRAVDRLFTVHMGAPELHGRLFYNDDMSMNIQVRKEKLPTILNKIDANEENENTSLIYLSSINIESFFNGFIDENNIDFCTVKPIKSIWIGTKTRIAAHNDLPDNFACVAVGKRRFTLFPPNQFRNLYLGPVDNTPAGRPVSMVDFYEFDEAKYPKFSTALKFAQQATLEPGDAIYIPSMWWHHVEGLDKFNVLVNYWWRDTPSYMGNAQHALYHAMLSVRDLPEEEKKHWRDLFDYYIFHNGPEVRDHLPEQGQGVLEPMTIHTSRKLRSFLLKALNDE